ncbi:MAG: PaaI family thioesterase [Myxococcota bacterium]
MDIGDEFDGGLFGEGQPCFGCAPEHPIGFKLRFRRQDDFVTTRFTPGEQYQGPPNIMHGGLVTTLADEVAAWAVVGLMGKFGFTAKIECTLHHPVRIGVELEGRSWLIKDLRRLADVGVRITQGDKECMTGTFRFVVMDKASAEKLMGRPLSEGWQRFSR